jgi:hypothetical protein
MPWRVSRSAWIFGDIRIEPWESSDFSWEHNRLLWGEGAVNEHPHGTICHISPRKPNDDRGVANASPKDLPAEFAAIREKLQPARDWGEDAITQAERLADDDDSQGVGDGHR